MAIQAALITVRTNPPEASFIPSSIRHHSSTFLNFSTRAVHKLQPDYTCGFRKLVPATPIRVRKSSSPRAAAEAGHDTHQYEIPSKPTEEDSFKKIVKKLQNANALLPYVVAGSAVMALSYPPSFSWFTNKYYAPALGFLMFAVGINLKSTDFIQALKRPSVLGIGYIGQYIVKPLLGVLFMKIAVSAMHLPQALGSGIVLMACVSGAQLSNYATFLVEPTMAPLSVVMTSLSTATAAFMTPSLTLFLLGTSLPVDVPAMMLNIIQIVMLPIAAGLFLNKFAAPVTKIIRPCMPLLSVLVTGCVIGSPLAINIAAVKSPFGLALVLLLFGFHAISFITGYQFASIAFPNAPDKEGLQKTLSFETGMQSSLLGLALANKFFPDPLFGLPSAISTALMSLMGFGLVVFWNKDKHHNGH